MDITERIKKGLPVIVIDTTDDEKFETRCAELLHNGYKLHSSSCGFIQSEQDDFCASFQAIFIHRTEL
jgi:hypothetical protein